MQTFIDSEIRSIPSFIRQNSHVITQAASERLKQLAMQAVGNESLCRVKLLSLNNKAYGTSNKTQGWEI